MNKILLFAVFVAFVAGCTSVTPTPRPTPFPTMTPMPTQTPTTVPCRIRGQAVEPLSLTVLGPEESILTIPKFPVMVQASQDADSTIYWWKEGQSRENARIAAQSRGGYVTEVTVDEGDGKYFVLVVATRSHTFADDCSPASEIQSRELTVQINSTAPQITGIGLEAQPNGLAVSGVVSGTQKISVAGITVSAKDGPFALIVPWSGIQGRETFDFQLLGEGDLVSSFQLPVYLPDNRIEVRDKKGSLVEMFGLDWDPGLFVLQAGWNGWYYLTYRDGQLVKRFDPPHPLVYPAVAVGIVVLGWATWWAIQQVRLMNKNQAAARAEADVRLLAARQQQSLLMPPAPQPIVTQQEQPDPVRVIIPYCEAVRRGAADHDAWRLFMLSQPDMSSLTAFVSSYQRVSDPVAQQRLEALFQRATVLVETDNALGGA